MLKKIRVFQAFSIEMKKKNISSFAAGTAFFTFLSLFPIAMLILSILPYTPVSADEVFQVVFSFVPDMFEEVLRSIIEECYEKSVTLISVSAVILIWASAKGTLSLKYGLDSINGVVETRNYVLMRLQASVETLIMIIVMLISIIIMVFGNILVELVLSDFPQTRNFYGFIMKFRFVFAWVLLTVVFTTLYSLFPNKKLKWKKQIPGAVFAAVVWSVFSWAFSLYVEYFQVFSMYGSFATVIISMLWLYCCMYIFLLGAYLNRFFKAYVLEFLAISDEESQEERDEEWEKIRKGIRHLDFESGKKFIKNVKNMNAEIAEALGDPSLGLSEEKQKEIMDKLRMVREEKKHHEEQQETEQQNTEQQNTEQQNVERQNTEQEKIEQEKTEQQKKEQHITVQQNTAVSAEEWRHEEQHHEEQGIESHFE